MRWSCSWWAPFGCRGSEQRLAAEHGDLVVSRVGHDLAARIVRDYRRAGGGACVPVRVVGSAEVGSDQDHILSIGEPSTGSVRRRPVLAPVVVSMVTRRRPATTTLWLCSG
jgi:hypothetical protein